MLFILNIGFLDENTRPPSIVLSLTSVCVCVFIFV